MENDLLYLKKKTGFLLKKEEEFIPSFIYQPTPKGVMVLCDHYSRKYNIDLQGIDLESIALQSTDLAELVGTGEDIYKFFNYLRSMPALLDTAEGQVRGLILSHGQHHVVPLLVTTIEGMKHMVIFDSNSGGRIKGYFRIANLFSDFQFYLNAGTRQADEGSCMTDAICILKEALLVENIVTLIQSKQITRHPSFEEGRFFHVPKPQHFTLFNMPERLLLTAQISKYLTQADADVTLIVRGGRSLQSYRDDFLLPVFLSDDPEGALTPINGYLYLKGEEHKRILDLRLAQDFVEEIDIHEELLDDCTSRVPVMDDSPYGFLA